MCAALTTWFDRLVKDPKPLVVGIAWVVECVEKRQRVEETRFLVDLAMANVAGVNRVRLPFSSLSRSASIVRMLTGGCYTAPEVDAPEEHLRVARGGREDRWGRGGCGERPSRVARVVLGLVVQGERTRRGHKHGAIRTGLRGRP